MAAAREHKNVLALFVDDSQFEVPVKRRGFDLLPHDGKAATRCLAVVSWCSVRISSMNARIARAAHA